jgi:hypothetical protein
MKIETIEAQIEAAISATFTSNLPSDQAVACVNRLLSAFKEIGQSQPSESYTNDLLFCGEDVIYN